MPRSSDRILWVDGLKGLLAVWIILFHYGIAFINRGYIGFATNYADGALYEHYFRNFPFSIFVNSTFPLYVFMFLIAFIPAYQFFKDNSETRITEHAKVRYFRLMIPTFAACVITFILHHAGLLRHVSVGEQTGVLWLQEIMKVDFSFPYPHARHVGRFLPAVSAYDKSGNLRYGSRLGCFSCSDTCSNTRRFPVPETDGPADKPGCRKGEAHISRGRYHALSRLVHTARSTRSHDLCARRGYSPGGVMQDETEYVKDSVFGYTGTGQNDHSVL